MIIPQSMRILNINRDPKGLFATQNQHMPAAQQNLFAALGLETIDPILAVRTYQALLEMICNDAKGIRSVQQKEYARIRITQHATNREISQSISQPIAQQEIWNNFTKGLLLSRIATLTKKGYYVLRNKEDTQATMLLIQQLCKEPFWKTQDKGMWGIEKKLHLCTLAACIAGLEQCDGMIKLSAHEQKQVREGRKIFARAFQHVLQQNEIDFSLLALIYPLNITTEKQSEHILRAVEGQLYRERGLIRFIGDGYEYKEGEAEWPVGFAWLALIYKQLKNPVKHTFYVEKVLRTLNENNELPELFFANTHFYNQVCPVVWGQSMLMAALTGR